MCPHDFALWANHVHFSVRLMGVVQIDVESTADSTIFAATGGRAGYGRVIALVVVLVVGVVVLALVIMVGVVMGVVVVVHWCPRYWYQQAAGSKRRAGARCYTAAARAARGVECA